MSDPKLTPAPATRPSKDAVADSKRQVPVRSAPDPVSVTDLAKPARTSLKNDPDFVSDGNEG
jgi:hypothetical protein